MPDANLRLALIDEVYAAKGDDEDWLELAPLKAVYEKHRRAMGGPPWDERLEGETLNSALQAAVLELPIRASELDTLDSLTLDGDREVYAIWPQWWKFGRHFVIRDLRGIEICRNLESLTLGQGMVEGVSLEPLRRLPKLRKLSLCGTGQYRDVEVLGELELDELDASTVPKDDKAWQTALRKVRARAQTPGTAAPSDDWNALFQRGYQRHESGDIAGALADYQRVVELNPSYAHTYVNIGNIHWTRDRDFAEAARCYDRAIDFDRTMYLARMNRAEARLHLHEFDGTLEDIAVALATQDSAHAHYLNALALLSKGRENEARKEAKLGWAFSQDLASIDESDWRRRLQALLASKSTTPRRRG